MTDAAARLARLQAGHAARFAWSDATVAKIREFVAGGMTAAEIARSLGICVKTLRSRAPTLGIDLVGVRAARKDAGDEVLRRVYPTAPTMRAVHDAYREATGCNPSLVALRIRANSLGLRRDAETIVARAVRATRVRSAQLTAERLVRAAAMQERANEGASRAALTREFGVAKETVRRMISEGVLTIPPPQPVVKPPKPPKPPRVAVAKPPKAVRLYAAPKPPPPPKPRPQTVEEWLANGGQITRCPTAAVLATQATVPAADLAALRQYHDQQAKALTWKQQRAASFKRAKALGLAT